MLSDPGLHHSAAGASLEATIKATANFDAVGTPLSNATNTAQVVMLCMSLGAGAIVAVICGHP